MSANGKFKVGNGVDVHPLTKGKSFILGGVKIHHDYGCDGHSDGDVLIHSMIDSILGALGKGDLGDHFPSSSSKLKDANSIKLLNQIYNNHLHDSKWYIVNIDATIILQNPIIKPYIEKMKNNISKFGIPISQNDISIKATTTDYLGFIGEGKGIAVITTCLLAKND